MKQRADEYTGPRRHRIIEFFKMYTNKDGKIFKQEMIYTTGERWDNPKSKLFIFCCFRSRLMDYFYSDIIFSIYSLFLTRLCLFIAQRERMAEQMTAELVA